MGNSLPLSAQDYRGSRKRRRTSREWNLGALTCGLDPPCDFCGADMLDKLVTQPGQTMYAIALLCAVCHGATEVPASGLEA